MKFVYTTYVLSVTVTVVTVKKMTIMTNDSYVFGTPIDTMISSVCPFFQRSPSFITHYIAMIRIFKSMRKK